MIEGTVRKTTIPNPNPNEDPIEVVSVYRDAAHPDETWEDFKVRHTDAENAAFDALGIDPDN